MPLDRRGQQPQFEAGALEQYDDGVLVMMSVGVTYFTSKRSLALGRNGINKSGGSCGSSAARATRTWASAAMLLLIFHSLDKNSKFQSRVPE
jgi:hypothetical protein